MTLIVSERQFLHILSIRPFIRVVREFESYESYSLRNLQNIEKSRQMWLD